MGTIVGYIAVTVKMVKGWFFHLATLEPETSSRRPFINYVRVPREGGGWKNL